MTMPSATHRLRCAVYTRKSTEEGLEQEFNSLDAQREACEAYVLSQASLGWKLLPDRYDDGGVSGGTMDRPALTRLLDDLKAGRIDVVVVYKIDRLTRSLTDFAKIVEVFDAAGAFFVSVTQQFNTTTSMGRLTLNVLLSFAQFEREVTAERIRDKIAASKMKGMWMGGFVPLGYRVEARKLHIVEEDAAIVRYLFARYLEMKSVRALAEEVNAKRLIRTAPARKRVSAQEAADSRTTAPSRRHRQQTDVGKPLFFFRGHLYQLLANPIYIGKIAHRGAVYDGEHAAVVDTTIFDAVQAQLAIRAPRRRTATNAHDIHLLAGILFDEEGERLRSVSTTRRGVRYRYYVSRHHIDVRTADQFGHAQSGWRLPARELERIVERELDRLLANRAQLSGWFGDKADAADIDRLMRTAASVRSGYPAMSPDAKRNILCRFFPRATLNTGRLTIHVDQAAIVAALGSEKTSLGSDTAPLRIECPIALRRRGVEAKLVLTAEPDVPRDPDPALLDVIFRAHRYLRQLTDATGRSLSQVAGINGTDVSEVSRLLPFAFLSPKIVDSILIGAQSTTISAQRLTRISDLPYSWAEQEARLAG